MQDTFWTPELWCEFLEGYSYSSGIDLFKAAEQFKASKSPKKEPVLVTVDGVQMRENEECWIVDKHYNLLPEPEKINEFKRNYFSNCFIFSTREAAEKYILENKPLLSLNDVKDVCSVPGMRVSAQTDILIEKLTALVKQKLNQ